MSISSVPGTLALSAPYACALYAEPGLRVISTLLPFSLVLVIASIVIQSDWMHSRSYRWNLLLSQAGQLGWMNNGIVEGSS